jgi:hypothetical protein
MPTRARAHKRNKSNPPKKAPTRTVGAGVAKPTRPPKMTDAEKLAKRKAASAKRSAEKRALKEASKPAADPRATRRQAQFDDAAKTKKLAALDRRWVDKIVDHRQRALARVIPDICAIFGMEPDDLIGRTAAETPAEMVINSHRKTCTGAIIHLGLSLGIRWNALHGRPAAVGQSGETEILDLIDAHRQSLASFRLQFCALAGLPINDENPHCFPPMGEVGQLVRIRFADIRATAFAEVGQVHAVDEEAAA